MSVDQTSILSLYDNLMTKLISYYDDMYNHDKIDAETYTKLVSEAHLELIKISVNTVQQQTQLEKDNELKDKQIDSLTADIELKTAQKTLIEHQSSFEAAKTSEINYRVTNILSKEATLIGSQIDKLTQEINILTAQYEVENDDDFKAAKKAEPTKRNDLLTAQQHLVETQDSHTNIQITETMKKIDLSEAQINLVDRQKQGFDDDAKQKLLKTALDAWSVAYSTSENSETIPLLITKYGVDNLAHSILDPNTTNNPAKEPTPTDLSYPA